jgi:DNA repair exonuclease
LRFIHAADIHLDSPLQGLSAYDDAPAAMLRNATRLAFSALVDQAIEAQVDFVVIAGDLYDGQWKDYNTGVFFCREMGRLRRAGIRAYVLFGNHDAESEMTTKLVLPDNVHCFSSRQPQVFTLDDLKVALHGQSFRTKATTDDLTMGYRAPLAGHYNIGVLHTALEGHAAHDRYAPCTLDGLFAKGYGYWALGHVHEYQDWRRNGSTVVFPGNLQGRSIREAGRRGAVLVNVDDAGHASTQRLFIDVLRWEGVEVDACGCDNLQDVVQRIGRALEEVLSIDANVPRAVRVSVKGRSRAHGELFGLENQLRYEVLGRIADIGNDRLWLEKVRVGTQGHEDAAEAEGRFDALAELEEILREAQGDAEFLAELRTELTPFLSKVQGELTSLVPALDEARQGHLAPLIDSVAPGLLAHIAKAG